MKYRNKEQYSLNCAEAILYAANEHYQIGLSRDALKMVAGFGGGVKEGHLCGTVSGVVSVLSVLFKDKVVDGVNLLDKTIKDFKYEFRKRYQSIDCNYLLDHHKDEVLGCDKLIVESGVILQEIIDKQLTKVI